MTISDADTGFFTTATIVVEKSGGEVRGGSASITNMRSRSDQGAIRLKVVPRYDRFAYAFISPLEGEHRKDIANLKAVQT